MVASRSDLSQWFDEGVAMGARNMIVKCDMFDWEDYPVYVMPGEDPRAREESNQDRTMEVYDLTAPKDPQINVNHRVFNYGEETP